MLKRVLLSVAGLLGWRHVSDSMAAIKGGVKSIAIAIFFTCSVASGIEGKQIQPFRFISAWTGPPTSFDPLDADAWANMPVARMLYLTPLEVSEQAQLSSVILEHFSYDARENTIHWRVRKGLKFSDGSPITSEDVAFSVARFAFKNPDFPVVKEIVGLKRWISSGEKTGSALKRFPEGIQVNGNVITIRLGKHVPHPLYRFCLEVFSIIPRKSVDIRTNGLREKRPPTSGRYEIVEEGKNYIQFNSRPDSGATSVNLPAAIRFEFVKPESVLEAAKSLDTRSVISGNGQFHSPDVFPELEKISEVNYQPSSSYAVFLLNPKSGKFKTPSSRRSFAYLFREAFVDAFRNEPPTEASVFTRIMPGFLRRGDLEHVPNSEQLREIVDSLKASPLRWAIVDGPKPFLFEKTLQALYRKFSISLPKPIQLHTRAEEEKLFVAGKLDVFDGYTGFWPLDPAGDLQMLLTPGFHESLEFVANDSEIRRALNRLEEDDSISSFQNVNRALFDRALFNVYTHIRPFLVAKKGNLNLSEVPVSVSQLYPWQVFEGR